MAALQQATRSIPVVFVVVTDPVGAGFVHSRARPGGNITGFSTFEAEIGGKWRRTAGILDPSFKAFAAVWRAVEQSAPPSGVDASGLAFRDAAEDIEAAIAAFARIAYGFDTPDLFRRGAAYVDRILKGDKPADMPVQAPTKFELVIKLVSPTKFS
jgi:putative ABC transport system substrate-binding protein